MNKPRISIIVAMDEKRGIGKENGLMWKIPGELARFKKITIGHPIIMGRKTYESIGRVLPGRTNIIITQNSKFKIQNAIVVHSLEDAIKKAKESIKHKVSRINTQYKIRDTKYQIPYTDENEIFIIGGGQIFEQALSFVDRLYLTIIEGDFGADTFFPDYSMFTKKISEEFHEDGGYRYRFIELRR